MANGNDNRSAVDKVAGGVFGLAEVLLFGQKDENGKQKGFPGLFGIAEKVIQLALKIAVNAVMLPFKAAGKALGLTDNKPDPKKGKDKQQDGKDDPEKEGKEKGKDKEKEKDDPQKQKQKQKENFLVRAAKKVAKMLGIDIDKMMGGPNAQAPTASQGQAAQAPDLQDLAKNMPGIAKALSPMLQRVMGQNPLQPQKDAQPQMQGKGQPSPQQKGQPAPQQKVQPAPQQKGQPAPQQKGGLQGPDFHLPKIERGVTIPNGADSNYLSPEKMIKDKFGKEFMTPELQKNISFLKKGYSEGQEALGKCMEGPDKLAKLGPNHAANICAYNKLISGIENNDFAMLSRLKTPGTDVAKDMQFKERISPDVMYFGSMQHDKTTLNAYFNDRANLNEFNRRTQANADKKTLEVFGKEKGQKMLDANKEYEKIVNEDNAKKYLKEEKKPAQQKAQPKPLQNAVYKTHGLPQAPQQQGPQAQKQQGPQMQQQPKGPQQPQQPNPWGVDDPSQTIGKDTKRTPEEQAKRNANWDKNMRETDAEVQKKLEARENGFRNQDTIFKGEGFETMGKKNSPVPKGQEAPQQQAQQPKAQQQGIEQPNGQKTQGPDAPKGQQQSLSQNKGEYANGKDLKNFDQRFTNLSPEKKKAIKEGWERMREKKNSQAAENSAPGNQKSKLPEDLQTVGKTGVKDPLTGTVNKQDGAKPEDFKKEQKEFNDKAAKSREKQQKKLASEKNLRENKTEKTNQKSAGGKAV